MSAIIEFKMINKAISAASCLLCLCTTLLCVMLNAAEGRVEFSSSMTNSNMRTVCPNETVLIYCTTSEAGLLWKLPLAKDNLVSFYTDDTTPPVKRKGSITLWRDSSQPLSSHIEIPYSPEFTNKDIVCESGGENQRLTYELADSPPEPDTLNYMFLSNGYVRLEWSIVGVAEHYLIASYFQQNESVHQMLQTNDTSVTILYHEGMIVTVCSINECHMKSSNYTSIHISMAGASWQEMLIVYSSELMIFLVSLATLEVVVYTIIIIILSVAIYYYKRSLKS